MGRRKVLILPITLTGRSSRQLLLMLLNNTMFVKIPYRKRWMPTITKYGRILTCYSQ